MKTKIILTVLFALLVISKINAQINNQEAVLTYQLAEEAYNKGQNDKAVEYLNKVETLNPDSKVKTSYLKAKCYGNSFVDNSQEKNMNIYNDCINCIHYYIGFGKDEEKMKEILKIKITLENSYLAKLNKKFSNMSSNDAFKIITDIMKQHVMVNSYYNPPWDLVWLKNSVFCITNCGWDAYGHYKAGFISINLSDSYINYSENKPIGLTINSKNSIISVNEDYKSAAKLIKYHEEDINNYKNGINKAHGNFGVFRSNNATHLYFQNIIGDFDKLSQETKDDVLMAFRTLIKNCGGGKKA